MIGRIRYSRDANAKNQQLNHPVHLFVPTYYYFENSTFGTNLFPYS